MMFEYIVTFIKVRIQHLFLILDSIVTMIIGSGTHIASHPDNREVPRREKKTSKDNVICLEKKETRVG